MRAPFLKTLPAFVAALVLALCSGCAGLPVGFAAAPVVEHVPVSADDVSGIQRGAGEMEVVASDEAWGYICALAVLAVVFVLYGLVWSAMQIYEAIDAAFAEEAEDAPGAAVLSR